MPIHVTLSEDAMPSHPTILITSVSPSEVFVNLLGVAETSGAAVVSLLRDIADGISELQSRGVIPSTSAGSKAESLDKENALRSAAKADGFDPHDTGRLALNVEREKRGMAPKTTPSADPPRPKFAPR